MDAHLEQIGARCQVCLRQDFLPFKCPHCTLSFCITHAATDAHACSAPQVVKPVPSTSKQESGISLRDLQKEHLARRQQPQQSTLKSSRKPVTPAQQSALQTLKSSLTSKFVLKAPSSSVAKDKIELQKLKNAAKGDASVPVDARVYVHISSHNKQEKIAYWVHQDWTVGRTLDAIAKRLSVVNDNARTQDESRRLHLLCDDLVLEPSQVIGKRVKDGSHVILFRGIRPV